jgi:glutaconate CoA-transferase subunit A
MGYTTRDNRFYTEWDRISRDREVFTRWVDAFILEQKDFEGYLSALEDETLLRSVLDG